MRCLQTLPTKRDNNAWRRTRFTRAAAEHVRWAGPLASCRTERCVHRRAPHTFRRARSRSLCSPRRRCPRFLWTSLSARLPHLQNAQDHRGRAAACDMGRGFVSPAVPRPVVHQGAGGLEGLPAQPGQLPPLREEEPSHAYGVLRSVVRTLPGASSAARTPAVPVGPPAATDRPLARVAVAALCRPTAPESRRSGDHRWCRRGRAIGSSTACVARNSRRTLGRTTAPPRPPWRTWICPSRSSWPRLTTGMRTTASACGLGASESQPASQPGRHADDFSSRLPPHRPR